MPVFVYWDKSEFCSQTHLYCNLTWTGSLCVLGFDLGSRPGRRADGWASCSTRPWFIVPAAAEVSHWPQFGITHLCCFTIGYITVVLLSHMGLEKQYANIFQNLTSYTLGQCFSTGFASWLRLHKTLIF